MTLSGQWILSLLKTKMKKALKFSFSHRFSFQEQILHSLKLNCAIRMIFVGVI